MFGRGERIRDTAEVEQHSERSDEENYKSGKGLFAFFKKFGRGREAAPAEAEKGNDEAQAYFDNMSSDELAAALYSQSDPSAIPTMEEFAREADREAQKAYDEAVETTARISGALDALNNSPAQQRMNDIASEQARELSAEWEAEAAEKAKTPEQRAQEHLDGLKKMFPVIYGNKTLEEFMAEQAAKGNTYDGE